MKLLQRRRHRKGYHTHPKRKDSGLVKSLLYLSGINRSSMCSEVASLLRRLAEGKEFPREHAARF
jgi:hypothetical protein